MSNMQIFQEFMHKCIYIKKHTENILKYSKKINIRGEKQLLHQALILLYYCISVVQKSKSTITCLDLFYTIKQYVFKKNDLGNYSNICCYFQVKLSMEKI